MDQPLKPTVGPPPEGREAALAALEWAQQHRDAAQVTGDARLLGACLGHLAAGLTLAAQSLGLVPGGAQGNAPGLSTLDANHLKDILEFCARAAPASPKELEKNALAAPMVQQGTRLLNRLLHQSNTLWATPGETKVRHGLAMAAVLAGLVTLMGLGVSAWRNPGYSVSASAQYSEGFLGRALSASDGDEDTEWLLPNQTTGWVKLAFHRPRTVHAVRVLNGRSPGWFDRAVRDFRLEALQGDTVVASAVGNFPKLDRKPDWQTFPLAAQDVTAVRMVITSFHGVGVSVAEIDVE